MATIKSFTDLEQSKKLAKFLPLESADYCWGIDKETLCYNNSPYPCAWKDYSCKEYYVPCWSLASLIDILPDTITDEDGTIFGLNIKKNLIKYYNPSMGALYATYHSIIAEDLVDACYELILKLHELNLL